MAGDDEGVTREVTEMRWMIPRCRGQRVCGSVDSYDADNDMRFVGVAAATVLVAFDCAVVCCVLHRS